MRPFVECLHVAPFLPLGVFFFVSSAQGSPPFCLDSLAVAQAGWLTAPEVPAAPRAPVKVRRLTLTPQELRLGWREGEPSNALSGGGGMEAKAKKKLRRGAGVFGFLFAFGLSPKSMTFFSSSGFAESHPSPGAKRSRSRPQGGAGVSGEGQQQAELARRSADQRRQAAAGRAA